MCQGHNAREIPIQWKCLNASFFVVLGLGFALKVTICKKKGIFFGLKVTFLYLLPLGEMQMRAESAVSCGSALVTPIIPISLYFLNIPIFFLVISPAVS